MYSGHCFSVVIDRVIGRSPRCVEAFVLLDEGGGSREAAQVQYVGGEGLYKMYLEKSSTQEVPKFQPASCSRLTSDSNNSMTSNEKARIPVVA